MFTLTRWIPYQWSALKWWKMEARSVSIIWWYFSRKLTHGEHINHTLFVVLGKPADATEKAIVVCVARNAPSSSSDNFSLLYDFTCFFDRLYGCWIPDFVHPSLNRSVITTLEARRPNIQKPTVAIHYSNRTHARMCSISGGKTQQMDIVMVGWTTQFSNEGRRTLLRRLDVQL